MDIVNINIKRYYNKAIKSKLGFVSTDKEIHENMVSNFVEHCYNNKNIYEKYNEEILNLNNKING